VAIEYKVNHIVGGEWSSERLCMNEEREPGDKRWVRRMGNNGVRVGETQTGWISEKAIV
jgi:hypothetical protein